ncbi:MAG: hypothetical protein PHC51_14150 [bacterium]|nr:hypothetical protein [bacterium]
MSENITSENTIILIIVIIAAAYLVRSRLTCFGKKSPSCSKCACNKKTDTDTK